MDRGTNIFNHLAALTAIGAIGAVILTSKTSVNVALSGSPEKAIEQIRATVDDPTAAHGAVESLLRRIGYVEEKSGGDVINVNGNFEVVEEKGNSLFPAMGGGQTATVSRGGQTFIVNLDLVPQDVTDNTQN